MQYVKKMCILRQVKQGFSGDGKSLSGLIKAEQYGKNLAVEVSAINFAPLLSGDYYCILADAQGHTEMLPLRGKSVFNVLSDVDVSQGFCGIICYVHNAVVPVAYGVNGDGVYDWKSIVKNAVPSVETNLEKEIAAQNATAAGDDYDDEKISAENYYEQGEKKDGSELFHETDEHAHPKSATQKQDEEKGLATTENANADGVLHPFKTDGEGYYRSVKHEIDELLRRYPRDTRLCNAFSCSEWVKIQADDGRAEYLVGVVYAGDDAKYVCYAVPAENKDEPPQEIAEACTFVPTSPFNEREGFFVIFQSAATGECIKPQKI